MLSGFHHVLSVRSHLEAGGAEQGILRQRLEHLRPGDRGGEPARPRPRERRRHLCHEGDEAGEFSLNITFFIELFSNCTSFGGMTKQHHCHCIGICSLNVSCNAQCPIFLHKCYIPPTNNSLMMTKE